MKKVISSFSIISFNFVLKQQAVTYRLIEFIIYSKRTKLIKTDSLMNYFSLKQFLLLLAYLVYSN